MRVRSAALLLLAGVTGCVATPAKVGGSTTLPLGDGGTWTLTRGAIDGGEAARWAVPDGAGEPVDAVVEPRAGHAALAYENALAFVDLSAFEPEPVFADPPGFAIRRLAIHGTLATVTGDQKIACYALGENGWNRVWTTDGPEPIGARLQFAVPITAEAYAAIGTGANGRPRLVRMSREQGSWVVANDEPLRNMNRVDATVSIGSDLFVFGVREEAAYRPVSSFSARVDPKDVQLRARKFDLERLVPYDLDAITVGGVVEVAVTDVAVSPDRVVLVVNGIKVLAYRNTDGSDWLQPIQQTQYSSPVEVTWIGGRTFRLSGTDRTWTEEFE